MSLTTTHDPHGVRNVPLGVDVLWQFIEPGALVIMLHVTSSNPCGGNLTRSELWQFYVSTLVARIQTIRTEAFLTEAEPLLSAEYCRVWPSR